MPMSLTNASALWALTVGAPDFQPNRPMTSSPVSGSVTIRTVPEIASPSSSSGSAAPTRSSSGIASNRPTPTMAGATRGEIRTSSIGRPSASSSS